MPSPVCATAVSASKACSVIVVIPSGCPARARRAITREVTEQPPTGYWTNRERLPADHDYRRSTVKRTLALAALSTLALSASASAVEPGAYSGVSVNKGIYVYGDLEPRTDKGKASFKAKSSAVTKFKLKGQKFMCGPSPVDVPVSLPKIALNSVGKGKGRYTDQNVGTFEVKITVRDNGKASGTITPTGLCNGKVTFSAKRN